MDVGFMRPLLVWRGYWIDEGYVMKKKKEKQKPEPLFNGAKNWRVGCDNCGQKPTVHPTGLCGPCCFGEAETAGGNW
ncbi:hypothetical protein HW877_14695 [Serratia marcescens]|uniref:hypothetical protein n=1 Tax=Serratia marcescens TaxID=615 RepID=UPI001FCFE3B2|nr:hypothetical protein [Serratia marcescens]UOO26835.1 hypothetical protein HW877_14695 [Serratia marcescens]HBB9120185.1 hypothetical protein [Serratia marcescens]